MYGRVSKRLPTGRIGCLLGGVVLACLSSCSLVEHGNVAFDISPDGERIVFAAADGDLYLFNLKAHRRS
jgi:hypothetical protein